jgi:hypothetical protein
MLRIAECYYGEIKRLSKSDFEDVEFPANYTAFVDYVKGERSAITILGRSLVRYSKLPHSVNTSTPSTSKEDFFRVTS